LISFERFICERENLVFDSLIYLEPVERFKIRINVMKFRSFDDSKCIMMTWPTHINGDLLGLIKIS